LLLFKKKQAQSKTQNTKRSFGMSVLFLWPIFSFIERLLLRIKIPGFESCTIVYHYRNIAADT